jgi:uncharacterized membrane protein
VKSTAHINGHPIHPMLIPYPFALLSSAAAFDIGARVQGEASWSQTARQLTVAGLATALLAAVPGIVDYFGSVSPRTKAKRAATLHALCNLSALACFALTGTQRLEDGRLGDGGIALALAGTGLLSAAGWLGGELVYHDHVAVVDAGVASTLAGRPRQRAMAQRVREGMW